MNIFRVSEYFFLTQGPGAQDLRKSEELVAANKVTTNTMLNILF